MFIIRLSWDERFRGEKREFLFYAFHQSDIPGRVLHEQSSNAMAALHASILGHFTSHGLPCTSVVAEQRSQDERLGRNYEGG